MSDNLDTLRKKITAIDNQLLKLVAERLQLARRIGQHKRQQQIAITNSIVEELILQHNLRTGEELNLPAALVRSLTSLLIDYATCVQQEEEA